MEKARIAAILIAFSLAVAACIEENMDLVNQPPQAELVNIRFINLAGDDRERQLVLEKTTISPPVAYAKSCETFKPPQDSVFYSVQLGDGTKEYPGADTVQTKRYMFRRNYTYTFVALPSADLQKPVGNVVILKTITSIPETSPYANIKFLNAYPDSTYKYSIRLGCPNGQNLGDNLSYTRVSFLKEVSPGSIIVSIVRRDPNAEEDKILLFRIDDLKPARQYAGIIYMRDDGSEGLLLFDEENYKLTDVDEAESIPDEFKISEIRCLNLSTQNITVSRLEPGGGKYELATNLEPDRISDYASVEACGSLSRDTILTEASATSTIAAVSLDVGEKYSVFAFDSETPGETTTIIAEPIRIYADSLIGRALIRVINMDPEYPGITVSLGARALESANAKFISGEKIAADLLYGSISQYVLLPEGPAPITIFSSASPATLVNCSYAEFEAGKQYIIAVKRENNEQKVALLEDQNDLYDYDVQYLQPGVFTQIVHAIPGVEKISIDVGSSGDDDGLLQGAEILYLESIATVLQEGAHSLALNGNSPYDFDADPNFRTLLVAAGDAQNYEYFEYQSLPKYPDLGEYNRRAINACREKQSVTIRVNSADETANVFSDAANLSYGAISSWEKITQINRIGLFYIDDSVEPNDEDDRILLQSSDVSFVERKNYTVIFAGASSLGYELSNGDNFKGYSAIYLQEF